MFLACIWPSFTDIIHIYGCCFSATIDRTNFGLGIFVCVTFVTFWLLNLRSIYWTEQSSYSWRSELRCLARLLNKKYTRNPESQSKIASEQYLLANTRNLWTSLCGFVYCIPTWPINPLSPNTPYDALLNSLKLSLRFPCKQVGRKFIFHLRQIAVWSFALFSKKTTYFVRIM